MHVDHNMHVIGCNMHVTCTLFRIGYYYIIITIIIIYCHGLEHIQLFCNVPSGVLLASIYSRSLDAGVKVPLAKLQVHN